MPLKSSLAILITPLSNEFEPMTLLKLLLVRHGQSVGNTVGRMEGTTSTGLTPLGRQQSRRLGQHLGATGWLPTGVYCSPLERATATLAAMVEGLGAELVELDLSQRSPTPPTTGMVLLQAKPVAGAVLDQPIPVTLLSDLKEYDAGVFNGLTWAEACDRYPDLCQRLTTSLDWQPIPQAETLTAGQARAQRFVAQLLHQHGNGDRILVIAHHWILQHVITGLMGCDRAWGLPMDNTACFEFWLDRDRWPQTGPNRLNTELWRVKRFNDTTHLQS
ncbi:histidine phosphatase family protein [Nodosilinea sp. E11]|uniref:histidine phosphatase family protein n=1 Tax=Nodosilinea sp. E11 TaxID=3037479 RepID=UPI002934D766|nr:histidine phosphatase family protein [Nodosilinea sp. E11]WOD37880.1 histidine phosphatase family protein [Nodosilinea sp. E11]